MHIFLFRFFILTAAFYLCCCTTNPTNGKIDAQASGFSLKLVTNPHDPEDARWEIEGLVGDKKYQFELDTGGTFTRMQWDEITSQFASVGTNNTAGALAKHSDDLIVIPKLRVGSFAESNLTVARVYKGVTGKRNLLGMNFLKNYSLFFLFDEGKVIVFDQSQNKKEIRFHDLFLDANFHPYIDITFQNQIGAKGVWDTGASTTVFDMRFVKLHPELFSKLGSTKGQDSSGKSAETPTYMTKTFTLAGFSFLATKVVVVDLSPANSTIKTPMDFILGYNILKKANWIFDFPNKKWAISKLN